MNKFILLSLLFAATTAVACGNKGSAPQAAVSAKAMTEARETFKGRCGVCHGNEGRGDGPGAAALTPKPRNFTDASWHRTAKDEDIKKTILMGGAAVGKSPSMPASPDLESQPELVEALVAVVREFKR